MPSSIKLTEPLDILVEYGYLDDETPYHKAVSNAVNDFSSDKTLGGEYNREYIEILQTEASKELKARRKKIDVKSFKEKFLNRKEEPVKKDATGTSSIVPYEPTAPTPDLSLPEGEDQQQETEGLKGIRDILDEILKVLRLDFKSDRKEARDARKAKLDADRKAKEDKLEGGLKKSLGIIGKSAKALLSPFQNIWDAIIKFLKFTLIGILFNDTLNWFQDPENQKKAQRIGKFFKDWWPALAAAGLLWLTPLGALLKGVVGLLTAIIPKLVIAIAANPYAALALVGTGVTIWGVHKLAGMKSRPTEAVDESVEEIGREETINELKEEQENRSVMGRFGDFFTGAGAEREQQIERLEGMSGDGSGGGWSDVKAEQNMGTFTGDGYMKEFEGTAGFQEFNEGGLVQSSSTQSNQSRNVQNYNEGGLVQHYNDQKSAQNFVQRYNEGGLVQNFNEGGMVDKELVYSLKKFKTEKVVKGGEIERTKTREKTQGSIKLEDLYEHQEQILSQLPQGTTIESIVNGTSGIDAEVLYPILQNSDAQAVSNAKERAVNMQFLQDNNLINSDNSVKGYSSFNQNFKGGGLVETYNNLTKIKNYKQGGFVSGPGGIDKVPARLTAGEFVMSKGAVQKFGVNTLASMNAAGGGTNVPTITQEYNQGGSVQYLEQEYNQGGVVQYLENGGVVGDVMKEPVGTPIVQSTNRTITLPTIPKKQQQDQKMNMTKNDIPEFRIPIISSQRSMILSSLGIQDLIGG